MTYELHHGDCLDVLPTLAAGSVDALVTDPPGALSFMGMEWDGDKGGRLHWVAWLSERMTAARRVVKPGHYGLVWALPRTSHWTACALEDAGWEIRDRITHIFGSGFPKHKNTLKPAVEDWWLIRNPGKTSATLNIDAARIGTSMALSSRSVGSAATQATGDAPAGRWPAHLILSHSADCNGVCAPDCPVARLDQQSGERKLGGRVIRTKKATNGYGGGWGDAVGVFYADTGGASRFFTCLEADTDPFVYAPKASRSERNQGCDLNTHPTVKSQALMQWLCRLVTPSGGALLDMFTGSGSTGVAAAGLGLSFIGIEQDSEYIPIARARLDNAYAPLAAMERAS